MRDAPLSYPAAGASLPRPGPLEQTLGIGRVVVSAGLLLVAGLGVLIGAAVPGRWRGARAPLWTLTGVCRAFLWVNGIRLTVTAREALREPTGFVFFNHVSYLDIPLLLAVRPFRFLAAAGVRRLPLIGWVARAVRTVFVHRGDGESREAARVSLMEAVRRSPTPIALAPEGGVQHGPYVQPFRHGAFEVAQTTGAPVLLIAVDYAPRGYAAWLDGESLLAGYWRLAARTEHVTAHVTALPPSAPVHGTPASVATEAERRINRALDTLWSTTPLRPDP